MHIISKRRLREFYEKNQNAEESLISWYKTVKKLHWKNFADVRKTYRTADIYEECVIFNIGGNKYRLIVKINYRTKRIYIRSVLSHKDYDKDKWKVDCKCKQ